MSWPHALLIGLWLVGLGICLTRNGEPTGMKYSFGSRLIAVSVWSLLLWLGARP